MFVKYSLVRCLLVKLIVLKTKEEKKRSTHACTHNCAARRTKYSRRLLSILAQQDPKHSTISWWGLFYHTEIMLGVFQKWFIKKIEKKKKKNGAHTHVRTTVQLGVLIFTSVVVYSRTTNTKIQQNTYVGLFWHINILLERKSCYFYKKKKKKRKKNGAHTNSSHNCAALWTQYSRRLLSILARTKIKPTKNQDVKWK